MMFAPILRQVMTPEQWVTWGFIDAPLTVVIVNGGIAVFLLLCGSPKKRKET